MAQLKNTTFDSVGSLDLPSGTTAQRPASPAAGMIRYNTTISDTEYYNGVAWNLISDSNPDAVGGTVVDTNIGGVDYRIHLFTTVGNSTFTVSRSGEVEYLIVAGGGGGSDTGSGGGGAGGLLTGFTTVTPQAYTITVGSGGIGTNSYPSGTSGLTGTKGSNSVALGFVAAGGGGGGGFRTSANSAEMNGGSGGGHRGSQGGIGGAGVAGQGNSGGTSTTPSGGPASGGGGAGSVGGNATQTFGGNGGVGVLSSITGTAIFYAGGGGGSGGYSNSLRSGIGGLGGGGNGGGLSRFIEDPFIQNGFPNTGGGGGGQGYNGDTAPVQGGGNGGSGIVIIRYRRNTATTTINTRVGSLPFYYNYDGRLAMVRAGLGLELDALNVLSYPETGNTWFDLSGNNRNFTGDPAFINNVKGIRSGSAWTCPAARVNNLLNTDDHSIFFVIKFNTTAANATATTGNFDKIFEHAPSSDRSPGIWRSPNARTIHWRYSPGNTGVDFGLYPTDAWVFFGQTKNGDTVRVYENGVQTSIGSVSYPKEPGNANINLFPGYSVNLANIANVMIYSRPLTDAEVLQNFRILSTRYGT